VEVEAIAVMLSWALYGAANHWMNIQTTPPENYVKQLVDLINHGIQVNNKRVT